MNFKELKTQIAAGLILSAIAGVFYWVDKVDTKLDDQGNTLASVKSEVDFMVRSPIWSSAELINSNNVSYEK